MWYTLAAHGKKSEPKIAAGATSVFTSSARTVTVTGFQWVIASSFLNFVLSGGLPVLAKPGDESVGVLREQSLAQRPAPPV